MAEPELHPYQHLTGWFDDGGHAPIIATMPEVQPLCQAAPHLFGAVDQSKPILLYLCWKQVFSAFPNFVAQEIGDCVSFGHGHGNDLIMTIEAYLGGLDVSLIHETSTEFIYGESRKIGGMLGRQDGSYGSAAVKAMMNVGQLPRGSVGTYDGHRAKQWGFSGPPTDMEQKAGAFKLKGAALVSSWDELVAAMDNGYPVTECSDWLPSGERDKDGFVGSHGRGGHCQLICGVRFDRPGAFILNNWPIDFYSGPQALDCPPGGGWVDREVLERRILGGGDNWALSGSPGFPKQSLPGSMRRTS